MEEVNYECDYGAVPNDSLWISVESRLPHPEELVIGTDGWYCYPAAYNKHDNRWRIQLGQIFGMDVPLSFIKLWMPVPPMS